MKQRLILFSALLIVSLLLGVASAAEEELLINVTHNGTDNLFKPGEVVNITADFNRSVDQATISVNNSKSVITNNVSMTLIGMNGIGGNSFKYDYTIPYGIVSEPLDLNISAFNSSIVGSKVVDDALKFDLEGYLNTGVKLNRTGTFRPGDIVNITANFSQPVDHANISIANNGLPKASNANIVGAGVTNVPMTKLGSDGKTFGYDYPISEDTNGPLDIDVSAFDNLGNLIGDESFPDEIGVGDPYIEIVSPTSQFVNKKCVNFNFTAYDAYQSGGQLSYTFYLNGIAKSTGVITAGAYKQLEFNLDDGNYTWEIKTRDSQGTTHTSGSRALYVDTKCPSVRLNSPLDCSKQIIDDATAFNFTCEDALAAQYTNLGLTYTLYIDGQVAKRYGSYGTNVTGTASSGVPVTEEVQLADGGHNWSVSVQDGAGNSIKSDVRKFYVDLNGLTVNLVSPDGGYVPANPIFNFTVTGNSGQGSGLPFDIGNESGVSGSGLPFSYKLLVDGKEVSSNCNCGDCNSCDCDEGDSSSSDKGNNNCVGCSGGNCDGSCFVVGKDVYSVKASVADGFNKNWTIVITDSTTGKTYQPTLKYFSVDSKAPAPVANLKVADIPGETSWIELSNSPGLYVSWNASTEKDLASKPYDVLISPSKPSSIEDMELVESTSNTSLTIVNCTGKSLVYGKDYWVAVVARDNATNYDKCFSMCGPVQTYEDMNITLNEGWNLKSVPKSLAASYNCPETVFGKNSTVIYWDGSCWQFPETIEPCKGYWVYTKEPCTTNVKLKGMPSGNPDVPSSLTLKPGWNMIGHTSTYCAPWNMTLSSLSDFSGNILNGILSVDSYKFSNLITYSNGEGWGGIIPEMTDSMSTGYPKYVSGTECLPVGALQTDGYMVPGQGYWIFMKDDGTYASIESVYNLNILQDTYSGNGMP